jgi:flagellar hook protein FlgE
MQAVPPRFGLVPTGDPDTTTLSPIRVLRPDMPLIPSPLGMEILDQLQWTPVLDTAGYPIPGQFELDWEQMWTDAGEPELGGVSIMEWFFAENFDVGDLQLPNFGVANNGDVTVLSGGRNVVIGQVAVAMFANPAGLEVAGNNLYRETASSGEVVVGQAGFDGAGAINGGGLEMSNVDMADQFTDMIVTQRGFQANSRIITVTDSMLEELVNLKR